MTPYSNMKPFYTYRSTFIRNSKVIGAVWVVFTLCYAIINVLVFLQPYWLVSGPDSVSQNSFGLYQVCDGDSCKGDISEFDNILCDQFKAAFVLTGVSALITLLCVSCLVLFFFCAHSKTVYTICAAFQTISFACLLAAILSFASGWNLSAVTDVCKSSDQFKTGTCRIGLTMVLAIICCVDAFFLAVLGFMLAFKRAKPYADFALMDPSYTNFGYNSNLGTINGMGGGEYSNPIGAGIEQQDRMEHISQFSTMEARGGHRGGGYGRSHMQL